LEPDAGGCDAEDPAADLDGREGQDDDAGDEERAEGECADALHDRRPADARTRIRRACR
jgi:hypothetical protein